MAELSSNIAESKTASCDVIEAVNLLAHGKRNLLCGEMSQAVNQLQEACRLLGKEYGETADECADAYYCYGSALLELHRTESAVFGEGIPGDSEDSHSSSGDSSENEDKSINEAEAGDTEDPGVLSEDLEEEDFQLSGVGIRASSTPIEPSSSGDNNSTCVNTNDTADSVLVTTALAGDNNATTIASSSLESEMKTNLKEPVVTASDAAEALEIAKSKTDADDDISNLQLAWEMLELSKLIYQRHDSKEMKLKLAENFLKLGEVGLETEQFEQATNDFSKCLEIQRLVLQEDDRRIAETLYQLGLASTMSRDYDRAVDNYHEAIRVMEAKVARLKRVVAGEILPDTSEPTDGFYTPLELAAKEIEELTGLIPDILAKIEDVKDEQCNADRVSVLMKESIVKSQQEQPSGASEMSGSGDGPSTSAFQSSVFTNAQQIPVQPVVNNISHLVRKKRKSDENALQQSDVMPKRIKTNEEQSKENHVIDDVNISEDPKATG